ncbi:DMT family transporter [Rhodophyticola sp. CCM32]|uniref:DMT family transporter n=1 Tax=Rhodophyticola sp. CCM32 TaxID=2916397 RepID=UPI00107F631F|nr:DMT family transporter [Rhodophyticola sp. CCM32]QBY01731.1 DMT family transporter [Rhodophyticola sp. CCM32]
MTSTTWLALGAIAIGGAAIATQAPINSRLGNHMGDPVMAAAISFGVGFLVLLVLAVLRGALPAAITAAADVPWWAWTGGALGAVYVWASIWSVSTLGVVTLVAALIFGQLTAALILDAVGAFGMTMREISWTRLAAVGFVGVGLILSRL